MTASNCDINVTVDSNDTSVKIRLQRAFRYAINVIDTNEQYEYDIDVERIAKCTAIWFAFTCALAIHSEGFENNLPFRLQMTKHLRTDVRFRQATGVVTGQKGKGAIE